MGKPYAKRPMKPNTENDTAPGDSASSELRWRTSMSAGPIYRGGVSFSADVNSGDVLLCRLVYAGPKRTNAEAHAALADRALSWIASYEARTNRPV